MAKKAHRRPEQTIDYGRFDEPNVFERYWPAALVFFVAVMVYLPSLQSTWIWDDPSYVTTNPTLRTAGGLWDIWAHDSATPQYYPLVFTTFWLEYHAYGLTPIGFHAVNILCHAAGACVLFLVLRRLAVPGAALAALLFAVHPVEVESVAWVTERKNVLSGLLYFLSAWCYLRNFLAPTSPAGKEGWGEGAGLNRKDAASSTTLTPHPGPLPLRGEGDYGSYYFASLALFIGALLSKTVTCSLPAALLLVIYWKRGRIFWRDVLPLVPFVLVALPFAWHTSWLEKTQVGAHGAPWVYGPTPVSNFVAKCLIAGRCVWFYAAKIVWPADLAFIYPRFDIRTGAAWQYAFPTAAVAVIGMLFALRHRIGRGPLVAVLFFVGTLFPAIGFIAVYPHRFSFVADHFQYLAGVGLFVLIGAAVARLNTRWRPGPAVITIVIVIILSVLTKRQQSIYVDAETLWRDTLTKNPDSWMANTNLGNALVAQRKFDEALPYFDRSVVLAPEIDETHWNYGVSLVRRERIAEAEAEFREAIRLGPKFAPAWDSLGALYLFKKNDPVAAEEYLTKALELKPTYGDSHFAMGIIREREGKIDEAIDHFRRAAADRPVLVEARYRLASLLIVRKKYDEASAVLVDVVGVAPAYAEAWALLAVSFSFGGHQAEANRALNEANRLDPEVVKTLMRKMQGGK